MTRTRAPNKCRVLTRRQALECVAAAVLPTAVAAMARSSDSPAGRNFAGSTTDGVDETTARATEAVAYRNAGLPPGIRSRFVKNINGLTVHMLEAGFETKGQPCVLLLHGFPELAYSWRKVMLPIASAGHHSGLIEVTQRNG